MGNHSIIGHEQGNIRPCVVVKVQPRIQMATVIPLTSVLRVSRFPYTHEIQPSGQNGLSSTSIAMIFQVRSVSYRRFLNSVGILEQNEMTEILDLISDFFLN
jgi:mRNA-degrading endonuclease toxin of MazEF toxin-antitoxin module